MIPFPCHLYVLPKGVCPLLFLNAGPYGRDSTETMMCDLGE